MTTITRRDLLKFAGGSILGVLFTPVPWKLLDDTSIWTQNWSLTPKLPRGPIAFRHTTCALCPAGCGVKVRTIGGVPTSLTGVASHPVSHGALCPAGLAGHHAAFNPLRLSGSVRFSERGENGRIAPADADGIIKDMAASISGRNPEDRIAILDLRPGRSISQLYAEFAAGLPGVVLIDPPNSESWTVDAIADTLGLPRSEFGIDYEHARVILSVGAPLFEGWGTFGRMQSLARGTGYGSVHGTAQGTSRGSDIAGARIIQAEPSRSETARHANPWLPLLPGSEGALVFGIANVLLKENLVPVQSRTSAKDLAAFANHISEFTPDRVAQLTGLPTAQIEEVARMLARETPAVVIAGANAAGGPLEPSVRKGIAALNLLLGSVAREGGIVRRNTGGAPGGNASPSVSPMRAPVAIDAIPDRSIRLLILDGAESGVGFPWGIIAPKLAENGFVVSFSPAATGLALNADAIIPAPAPYESLSDIPTPWDGVNGSLALSAQLFPPNPGSHDPYNVMMTLARSAGLSLNVPATTVDAIRQRVARTYESKRGSIFTPGSGTTSPVVSLSSAEELFSSLESGAVWLDDPVPQRGPGNFSLCTGLTPADVAQALRPVAERGLVMEISGVKGEINGGSTSPLMTKLYQESGLRDAAGLARMNPATAAGMELADGSSATIRTAHGSRACTIRTDASINPKIVRVASGPAPAGDGSARLESETLALCDIEKHRGWRYTPATLEKGA